MLIPSCTTAVHINRNQTQWGTIGVADDVIGEDANNNGTAGANGAISAMWNGRAE